MPLILDVALYDTPVGSRTNSGSIIAISPELSAPEIFPELRQFLEQFTGSDAFELPYDLANAVLRVKAHQQVYVVLVVTSLFDLEVVPQLDFRQGVGDTCHRRGVKQSFPILYRKDQVVVCVVGAVVRFRDSHVAALYLKGNLRFPSDSPPPREPTRQAAG
jgi:hypothetical protein